MTQEANRLRFALYDVYRTKIRSDRERSTATTWACETFADFVLGKEFLIETDQKLLVPLLGSKCLQDMPPRIQRFRMRLMRYLYQIVHVSRKDLTTADTLSRAQKKKPKIKQTTLIGPKEKGGLSLPDFDIINNALKATWILSLIHI